MKKIIGRTDKADFPAFNMEEIDIKIDTGAYTSSIHCSKVSEENGVLTCLFLDKRHPQYHRKPITFTDYKITKVKSSNGMVQSRYEIKSTLKIFEKTYKISLTLADRNKMQYPVLIGRKFLSKKFIVDSDLTDVSFKATRK